MILRSLQGCKALGSELELGSWDVRLGVGFQGLFFLGGGEGGAVVEGSWVQ